MEKNQLRENEKISNSKNVSNGGLMSQMIMNSQLMQQKAKEQESIFGNAILQKKDNKTGLPDNLKSGMESLSGVSLDGVKVNYNSSKPASVQAHAFASGNEIHLASGQEKHLPHELGHVVQQAQGRVKPTTTVGGVAVNDSPKLESEATRMGERALQMKSKSAVKKNFKMQNNNITQLTKWKWTGNEWKYVDGFAVQGKPKFTPSEDMIGAIYDDETKEWSNKQVIVKETSDIKQEYNVKVACVLQSLFTAGHKPLGAKNPFELHNILWSSPKFEEYREYDLDSVYPKLYTDLVKLRKQSVKTPITELVEQLKEGRYIVELPGTGDDGHNSVLIVSGKGKHKRGDLKDGFGNQSKYKVDEKTIVIAVWM